MKLSPKGNRDTKGATDDGHLEDDSSYHNFGSNVGILPRDRSRLNRDGSTSSSDRLDDEGDHIAGAEDDGVL